MIEFTIKLNDEVEKYIKEQVNQKEYLQDNLWWMLEDAEYNKKLREKQ